MWLEVKDWIFEVDVEATRERTTKNAADHCDCAYCVNFYQAVELCWPELIDFLLNFGVNFNGPSELMPFEPTLMLACYRVQGRIEQWGYSPLGVKHIPVTVEAGEEGSFLLWVGEVPVPWLQPEPVEDVVSPANLPDFMQRMQEVWLLRHGDPFLFS